MSATARTETNRRRRHRPPRTGPYAVAPDPIADARAALARGVFPEIVARRFMPPIIRRRHLAAFRALLAAHDGDAAFLEALDAELRRQALDATAAA